MHSVDLRNPLLNFRSVVPDRVTQAPLLIYFPNQSLKKCVDDFYPRQAQQMPSFFAS